MVFPVVLSSIEIFIYNEQSQQCVKRIYHYNYCDCTAEIQTLTKLHSAAVPNVSFNTEKKIVFCEKKKESFQQEALSPERWD